MYLKCNTCSWNILIRVIFFSEDFKNFNYFLSNHQHYGQFSPPDYNLNNYNTKTLIMWSSGDTLSGKEDVYNFVNQIQTKDVEIYHVQDPAFGHIDFLWGTNAKSQVYNKVFDYFNLS